MVKKKYYKSARCRITHDDHHRHARPVLPGHVADHLERDERLQQQREAEGAVR